MTSWAPNLGTPGSGSGGKRSADRLADPDFTTPDGPARLGADLGTVARTADEAGFDFIAVMDHFFQFGAIGAA
jgi:alkanesulfonate monooxygenase SsuD/methylene tetrahydromethanopterin reductase-like flavin-dependent oxidoreductase (luciferase family)